MTPTTTTMTTTTPTFGARELLGELGGDGLSSCGVFEAHVTILGKSRTADFEMKLEFISVIVEVTCGVGGAGVTHLLDDSPSDAFGGWIRR